MFNLQQNRRLQQPVAPPPVLFLEDFNSQSPPPSPISIGNRGQQSKRDPSSRVWEPGPMAAGQQGVGGEALQFFCSASQHSHQSRTRSGRAGPMFSATRHWKRLSGSSWGSFGSYLHSPRSTRAAGSPPGAACRGGWGYRPRTGSAPA